MTTTTKIAGEAMTDEWRTAFDDRHEFDVYPEHFMSGLRNEFAAGWHAAMKSQAHALLASKQAIGCAVDGDEIGAIRKASELMCAMGYTADASQITCFLARVARAYPTAPAQLCGEDAAEQADEAVKADAAISACALMIKGICMTQPQEKWVDAIKNRIQFMLHARAKDSK